MQFILTSGGIGDALLGVAESFRLGKPTLIHGANRFNREIIQRFLDPFEIPTLVLDGSFMEALRPAFASFKNHPGFRGCCHLPDDMNYMDWMNRPKYEPRVPTKLDVQGMFGTTKSDKPLIAIVPAGSQMPPRIGTPYGEFQKTRVLTTPETTALAHKFLRNHKVIIVGSHEHELVVKSVDHPNCFYVTAEYTLERHGKRTPNTVEGLYQLLNSCEHVYSVDTWVKTYSCFAGVPTTVIRTKYKKLPPQPGQQTPHYLPFFDDGTEYPNVLLDVSENIFLNQSLWNLEVDTIENLIGAK